MKFLTVILSLCFPFTIFAGGFQCLSVGGYYGNVSVHSNNQTVEVYAAQGFAYELSKELKLPGVYDVLHLSFPAKGCQIQGKQMECFSKNVRITGEVFNGSMTSFKANATFTIREVSTSEKTYDEVSLQINDAKRTVSFGNRWAEDLCVIL